MQWLAVDLHVHTVLSPCAEVEMIPPLIVRQARALKLDVIAITDHNAAGNAHAVIEAARGADLIVLPGIEVQTREEVHVLCLFDTAEQAMRWQERVWAALPDRANDESLFGAQYAVDCTGEYLYTVRRLLATSAALSIGEVARHVRALGGICLPAHVDRSSYSLFANLGFVPEQLDVAGLELSRWTTPGSMLRSHPELARYGMVVDGDAHRLNEMIARTHILVEAPTVSELRLALARRGGRNVYVDESPPLGNT